MLIGLGMPEAPDLPAVRNYLTQVLGDPDVIRLPRGLGWLNPLVGATLSRFRAARLADKYQLIWTEAGAPLRAIAEQQAAALASKLPAGMQVFRALRYGRPGIAETLAQIAELGIEELIAVSMCPQYSGTITLPAVRELYRQINRSGYNIDVTMRSIWYDDTAYVNAQARLIHEYARTHRLTPENTQLVYALRSLPMSYIDRGDPYMDQIHRTAELVSRRLGWPTDRSSHGYQGGSGAAKWLQPTTSALLADLSRAGQKQVLVCPLSFTTDCLETLYEIQIRYRAQFEQNGGRLFACPALNTYEPFIAALRNLVLHGRHPASCRGSDASLMVDARTRAAPAQEVEAPIESLVMMGVALAGRLEPGQAPAPPHTDAEAFRQIKKSQCEVPDLLRDVCQDGAVREGLLWNTCRRFEFYGWLQSATNGSARAEVIAKLRRQLFNQNGRDEQSTLQVLHGADAWQHLVRTAVGLNSGLPGEREVLEQLRGALQLAERAGTAGPLMAKLLADVASHEHRLREQTEWGRFKPDYCYAAISQVARSAKLDLPACRCVVIGGSTTSCGILETLAERFGVSRRKLTLLHRGHGHGGRLKLLRRAIGHGRRERVHKYNERSVLRAIAQADVVFIGLDRKEAILDAEQIRTCRDFAARPVVIVDFNMFGSTVGMEDLAGVRLWNAADLEAAVTAFADEMCASPRFSQAAEAAESWIRDRVPASCVVSVSNRPQGVLR